jgi:tetratricopeptide (TPR) repeat protein
MRGALDLLWKLVPLLLAMVPVIWLLWNWLKRSDEPGVLIVRWIVSFVTMVGVLTIAARAHDEAAKIHALMIGLFGGLIMTFIWRQRFCDWVGDQITSLYTGGQRAADAEPCYSFAEARRKKGQYDQAMIEVQTQLAKFPNDFRGWMLLAEIHSEDRKDLAAARETIEQLLSQPGHAAKNIAYALNRLADWSIKLAQDRDAAQAALEQIVERVPDTEQAHFALQRLAHLAPARASETAELRVPLPPGAEQVGLRQTPLNIRPAEEDPAVTASNYVQHLEQFPFDNDAREKLALIYARHYQRLDLAADQLDQLITFPNQSQRQVVHWLNLLADLQIEVGADADAARQTLQRIVDEFPKSAAAETALNRMSRIKLELRGQQKSQAVKLGSYEQNIGLKGTSRPPRS